MIGVNGGVDASQVYFSPSVKQIPIFGYFGGIVFKHISEPHKGIQLELNYVQKGWEENLDTTNVYSRRFNYLEYTFMSHFEIGKRNTKLLLNVGPTFSYLLSDSITKYLIDGSTIMSYYDTKIQNKVELGLCLGLGVIQSTNIGDFHLEFRYSQGINNIFKDGYIFEYSMNQIITARLSCLFRINRR
jgi:hypothetical protein